MGRYCRNCRGRCHCHHSSDNFVTEVISKIVDVPDLGAKGDKGDKPVTLYATNLSETNPPLLDFNVLNPVGWSRIKPQVGQGEFLWTSQGYVSFNDTELIENWSTPTVERFNVVANFQDASLTEKGIVQIATEAEVLTGTNPLKTVTPETLQAKIDSLSIPEDIESASETIEGTIQIATLAEVATGTNTTKAVTPEGVRQEIDGINLTVPKATQAQVNTGLLDDVFITPLTLEEKLTQGSVNAVPPIAVGVFSPLPPLAYDTAYEEGLRTALINTQNALNTMIAHVAELKSKLDNVITK